MPFTHLYRQLAAFVACAWLFAGCSTAPPKSGQVPAPGQPPSGSSKYYKDDGPGESPPPNLDQVPDATPRLEPLHRFANRPYTVMGQDFVPATSLRNYRETGIASWYGRKFHGQKTAIGENYDMYAMTAAHPTLPLPSYARVTNVANGKSVVVRVNDRGPFLHGRLIDLSYAAAYRIGVAGKGSGEVMVEAIIPGESPVLAAAPSLPPVTTAAPAVAEVVPSSSSSLRHDSAGGFAVQLGAFQNYVNAQTFLAHVQAQLAAAQVEPKVRQANGLYRVYLGPYVDREEARRVADRISGAFGVATSVGTH